MPVILGVSSDHRACSRRTNSVCVSSLSHQAILHQPHTLPLARHVTLSWVESFLYGISSHPCTAIRFVLLMHFLFFWCPACPQVQGLRNALFFLCPSAGDVPMHFLSVFGVSVFFPKCKGVRLNALFIYFCDLFFCALVQGVLFCAYLKIIFSLLP